MIISTDKTKSLVIIKQPIIRKLETYIFHWSREGIELVNEIRYQGHNINK